MSSNTRAPNRFKLQHLLFSLLLLAGILPLVVNSVWLIRHNRDLLESQEMSNLTRAAHFLSLELDGHLVSARELLAQLGDDVLSVPVGEDLETKLRQPWLGDLSQRFLADHPDTLVLRMLNSEGQGPEFAVVGLNAATEEALLKAFGEASEASEPLYRFLSSGPLAGPVAVLTVPVIPPTGEQRLYVQGVVRLTPMETFFQQEAVGSVGVFLIERQGGVLWSVGADERLEQAIVASDLIRDFVAMPLNMTGRYELAVDGDVTEMLGRVSPVGAPGWGVVVQKPASAAFGSVRQMVVKAVLSTGAFIVLALVAAAIAARRIGQPIQELTEISHEIAEGNFGKRVAIAPVGAEIDALASNFNRMSNHLEAYVQQLQKAAQANRELFIGSMRAFVAAIDAKDPYTRGHSERVAAYSRTIARQLGSTQEVEHRIWVGALLHDVGKIGVDDKVLKKGGVLTSEEYEEMKKHPVIGAEIMSRIEPLKMMIPAIRWHHEAWNGRGYPDGLAGERIPLMARIVGVADTFDAITTNRPYQRAYEPAFAVQKLKELAGQRFDAKIVTAFLRAFEAGLVKVKRVPAEPTPADVAQEEKPTRAPVQVVAS